MLNLDHNKHVLSARVTASNQSKEASIAARNELLRLLAAELVKEFEATLNVEEDELPYNMVEYRAGVSVTDVYDHAGELIVPVRSNTLNDCYGLLYAEEIEAHKKTKAELKKLKADIKEVKDAYAFVNGGGK